LSWFTGSRIIQTIGSCEVSGKLENVSKFSVHMCVFIYKYSFFPSLFIFWQELPNFHSLLRKLSRNQFTGFRFSLVSSHQGSPLPEPQELHDYKKNTPAIVSENYFWCSSFHIGYLQSLFQGSPSLCNLQIRCSAAYF
jgi:hypothetical protein